MKIFNKNLRKNSKTIHLQPNSNYVGLTKYFPSFAKEWKNTVYSYNENLMKNLPVDFFNINKVIKGYFNLYFKNYKFIGDKFSIFLRKRRKFLNRILVSNANIKHTNNKAVITLYVVNREKVILKRNYLKLRRLITANLIRRYIYLYQDIIPALSSIMIKNKLSLPNYFKHKFDINTNNYINYKFEFLSLFLKLKQLYLKKIWTGIIKRYTSGYWNKNFYYFRRYNLLYSLNQYKVNNLFFLPLLTKWLIRILGKKVEYNIINLKSLGFNTDILTNLLAIKVKKKKTASVFFNMAPFLHSFAIPREENPILERVRLAGDKKLDVFFDKYKDLKVVSNLKTSENLDVLLQEVHSNEEVHKTVYDSIGYKNMRGIKIEVKGRLTKRYRADRAKHFWKSRGGLRNINSSFNGLNTVLFRGNSNSNVSYSWTKAKRRIGSFGVKAWIAAK